jgi:asparagine synthase (glutamine-hydrolysing)
MCGICGYIGDDRPELLERMASAMIHRGPDDSGTWHDQAARVGLAHRRLSIIDLSPAGHQPMTNEDGTIWISFNGEIYNYPELRERLLAKGHKFRSNSDTETIIHLYEEMGTACLNELNGIFAFALWDGRKRELMLARDHAGIKPLYYRQDGDRLYFASEIKALLQIPDTPRRLNRQAIHDYLTFLWVPGSETMLEGIRKVEPGHMVLRKNGKTFQAQWFNLVYECNEKRTPEEWVERVHYELSQAIRRQMVSDVPLGAFLSGGADSSSIVACMRDAYPDREINCYTVKLDPADMGRDQFQDDYPYAKRVADHLRVNLKTIELRSDVIRLLPKMIWHLDEPDADPAVFPSYLISKLAHEDGTTVLLSGTGGDEVFFGYRSHLALRQFERLKRLPRWAIAPLLSVASASATALLGAQRALPRRLAKFNRMYSGNGIQRYLALSDWSSESVRDNLYSPALAAELSARPEVNEAVRWYYDSFIGRGELNRRSHVLIQTFLAAHNFLYTDKSSMAVSLEARVPFLDVELMQLAARIPEHVKLRGGTTKWVLKKAMERHLPTDILYRSKTGFGAPLRKWIAEDLKDTIADLLSPARLAQRGLFDPAAVAQILRDNKADKADHAYLIYALLTLELWMMTFIDRAGEEVTT